MKKNIFLAGCLFVTAFLCVACKNREVELFSDSEILSETDLETDYATASLAASGKEPEMANEETVNKKSSDKKNANRETSDKKNSDRSDLQTENSTEKSVDSENEDIYVQVGGAVINPGVYRMNKGQRIFEAVSMAGGMTKAAAVDAVNQSLEIKDGQMIYIPTQSQWQQSGGYNPEMESNKELTNRSANDEDAQTMDDGLVNINTADINKLCTIPGIGKTRAEQIITYREKNGKFSKIEDIKKVSGIKDGLFDKIKDKIKV